MSFDTLQEQTGNQLQNFTFAHLNVCTAFLRPTLGHDLAHNTIFVQLALGKRINVLNFGRPLLTVSNFLSNLQGAVSQQT